MNFFNFSSNILFIILSADTSFKFLAIILFEIRHLQNFIVICLSKGRNLTSGGNSGKTKNMRRLFFHEESIHEADISMPPPPPHTHTDKPKPICPPLFQSWGHKKGGSFCIKDNHNYKVIADHRACMYNSK